MLNEHVMHCQLCCFFFFFVCTWTCIPSQANMHNMHTHTAILFVILQETCIHKSPRSQGESTIHTCISICLNIYALTMIWRFYDENSHLLHQQFHPTVRLAAVGKCEQKNDAAGRVQYIVTHEKTYENMNVLQQKHGKKNTFEWVESIITGPW